MPGIRANIQSMTGYIPGEQPRDGEYLKLNTNENPYPPSPRVIDAIRETLASDRLRKYPEPLGDIFRQTAASVLGVKPAQILIGNGSDDILTIVTRAFVPEGGLVAALTPSYVLYRSLAEIQGARFQTVPFTFDWQLPRPWPIMDADLTFVANPNSPSGTMVDPESVFQLARAIGSPVVLDEAYADFADDSGLSRLGQDNVLITRTLSKSYALAGIRFGFGLGPEGLIRELLKVKDSYNCDVLSLAAATAALQDQDYLRATRSRILTTRGHLRAGLCEMGFEVSPSQANFVWARRGDRPMKPIYEALKLRKILVRYMSYPEYGDGLRITVGTNAEIDKLLTELRNILAGR